MPRKKGMAGHEPGSHQGTTNVWLTPPPVLDALGGAQSFDLDPCAVSEPRPWPTAKRMVARPDDGLATPWYGRVWMNPPYGKETGIWMKRLAEHGTGTALIFARTETSYWHEWVFPHATGLFFFKGRLNFFTPDGRKGHENAGAPSVLVAYGARDAATLAAANLQGHYVALKQVRDAIAALPLKWRAAVVGAFMAHGGQATLRELYTTVQRPTGNLHWREQVRKQAQRLAVRVAPATYKLRAS